MSALPASALVVTPLGWAAIVLWVVGGLVLGVAAGVHQARYLGSSRPKGGEWDPGALAGVAWIFAPLVVAGGVLAGAWWLLNRLVHRVERTGVAQSREDRLGRRERDLTEREERIRALEDETGVDG